MVDSSFFNGSLAQSKAKAEIVAKYFYAWATIILNRPTVEKVAYIDLYCGPGKYEDGTSSTPLKILERAILHDKMNDKVVTMFNDKDPNHVELLKSNIQDLEGLDKLKYSPDVVEGEVDEKMETFFKEMNLIPSLVFIDPWGYKGLSVNLISALFKDWGSDVIFFFNYNRVNMGLSNPVMKGNMNRLFGEKHAEKVKSALTDATPKEREEIILSHLFSALSEKGAQYFQPFKFKKKGKTSHFLIFITKHPLGYSIMKGIMAKECICDDNGVPTFEFDCTPPKTVQTALFKSDSLDKLGDSLLADFKGQQIPVKRIIEQHHVGKVYIDKNYKDAIKRLENNGKIVCEPPSDKRRKIKGVLTLADKVLVTFPN
jgi:three-Cys-motif partner protein